MICKHPLGFTLLRDEQIICFDCKTPCPGYCVCGSLYRTMWCMNRGHVGEPRLAETGLTPTNPEKEN